MAVKGEGDDEGRGKNRDKISHLLGTHTKLDDVLHTKAGTFAGTPWADFAYTLLLRRVFTRISLKLLQHDLVDECEAETARHIFENLSVPDQFPVPEVSFVDDGVIRRVGLFPCPNCSIVSCIVEHKIEDFRVASICDGFLSFRLDLFQIFRIDVPMTREKKVKKEMLS